MKKIKYINGDVLDPIHKFDAVLHCANCRNTMGSGIAKQIREKHPDAYDADTAFAEQGRNKLGVYSWGIRSDMSGFIINLYGQDSYGREKRQLNYEAIYSAMERFKNHVALFSSKETYRIGVPYLMGCDRAGGEWSIIEAMIEHIFRDDLFDVTVVKWNK